MLTIAIDGNVKCYVRLATGYLRGLHRDFRCDRLAYCKDRCVYGRWIAGQLSGKWLSAIYVETKFGHHRVTTSNKEDNNQDR